MNDNERSAPYFTICRLLISVIEFNKHYGASVIVVNEKKKEGKKNMSPDFFRHSIFFSSLIDAVSQREKKKSQKNLLGPDVGPLLSVFNGI